MVLCKVVTQNTSKGDEMAISSFNTLTSKQKKVYSAIESYIKMKGIPPTVREIGEMVGEKTPGAVQGILNRLEQKGAIRRQAGAARSIQLVSDEDALYVNPVYIPEIKRISPRNIDDLVNIYNVSKYHPFSPEVIGAGEGCYMIKCPDSSLAESGIKHEDLLIVSMNDSVKDGDIILALIEKHVVIRYYYSGSEPDSIVLKADTNLLDREMFKTSEVKIAGKLLGRYTSC